MPTHCAVTILFKSVPAHQMSWLALKSYNMLCSLCSGNQCPEQIPVILWLVCINLHPFHPSCRRFFLFWCFPPPHVAILHRCNSQYVSALAENMICFRQIEWCERKACKVSEDGNVACYNAPNPAVFHPCCGLLFLLPPHPSHKNCVPG